MTKPVGALDRYIRFTPGMITDDDEVTVKPTEALQRNYMKERHAFIERALPVLPREP
jgi:chromate reductase